MGIKRRSFFKLLAGAMLAPVAAKAAALIGAPQLIGDGVHNDGPALNALLRGDVVEFGPLVNAQGVGWVSAKELVMPRGRFMSHETLIISSMDDITIQCSGAEFRWHDVDIGMDILGNKNTTICDIDIDASGVRRAAIYIRSKRVFSPTRQEIFDWVAKDASRMAIYPDGTVLRGRA